MDPALQFDSQGAEIEDIIDAGLAANDLEEAKGALEELKRRREPYLNWAGKAERTSFQVPTVSLHVHERIDPKTIIEAVRKRGGDTLQQLGLFETPGANPPLRDAIEFYQHDQAWANRLIAGDSLLVMNSLLEKEGMASKVQMIYIDPPYGIRYGSNFQPFVNRRDVRDGRDEDLTQEPEMIRAFRDTWELGIHSYLTYLRDRLRLARELLHEKGSVFVQIDDENLHLARNLMDEIFGERNAVVTIVLKKKGATTTTDPVNDYLLWYAKDRSNLKVRDLFLERNRPEDDPKFNTLIRGADELVRITGLQPERVEELLLDGYEFARVNYPLVSQEPSARRSLDFHWNGRPFSCGVNRHWTFDPGTQMRRLADAGRLFDSGGKSLGGVIRWSDFPYVILTNMWDDLHGDQEPIYVVQTNRRAPARCVLMTTDPGDLVFDPTCGSGTTAYVAEQWGRRWITCDTSRVSITLAKQRLMTASYDYYDLAHPDEGVRSGFVYGTVPHVTLKSIANDEPPEQETLYDQSRIDRSKARVTGPFTVEAVPSPMVQPLDGPAQVAAGDGSVARTGETLRHAEWRAELLKTGVRGKNGQMITFSRVEPLPGTRYLHADAETMPNALGAESVREAGPATSAQRVVVSFGPEHAPLEQRQVEEAWQEALTLAPRPAIVLFAAFHFDPEAAKDIDELTPDKIGMTLLKVQMNTDLLTDDLKKKRSSNESFFLVGQPDVELREVRDGKASPQPHPTPPRNPLPEGEGASRFVVEVFGSDYFNTKTGEIESGDVHKIAMWMLDTDYDGRSLYPRQVFFPMAGDNEGWGRLARSLRAEIDPDLIEGYRGTVSLPFERGEHGRVAVKIVDDRGIESLKVIEV
ncbi:MAG: site-specific DNA-methyltransferase [Chloroflexi bacterium]|nr:site-specific DNA-methyltransferase [Chloroflexota bacterium]